MRISASWTYARFRQIAETIEILHENEDQARDHFSNMNISSLPQPTCKAYCFWSVVGKTCITGIDSCRAGCDKNYSQKHWPYN